VWTSLKLFIWCSGVQVFRCNMVIKKLR